jgi:hypothetical protein
MSSFERRARFYERRHEGQADRLLVISTMIDARAQKAADRLGIETSAIPPRRRPFEPSRLNASALMTAAIDAADAASSRVGGEPAESRRSQWAARRRDGCRCERRIPVI